MTHWLAHIPYLPTWTSWQSMQHLAQGGHPWMF